MQLVALVTVGYIKVAKGVPLRYRYNLQSTIFLQGFLNAKEKKGVYIITVVTTFSVPHVTLNYQDKTKYNHSSESNPRP